MATRFKRLRAYFSGRPRACSACGHSHVACAMLKVAVILFFSSVVSLLTPADVRGDSFVEFDYNAFSGSRLRSSLFVQLYDDRPLTTANFLKYVNGDLIGGLYNNTLMHRLDVESGVPFVLQGGGYYPQYIAEPATPLQKSLNPNFSVDLDRDYATANPKVNSEFNNPPLHSNVKGTIAMAQTGTDPNSATSQYFFNLNDNSTSLDFLNGGFTVFGKVAGDGMSLIDGYLSSSNLYIVNMNPDTNDDGVGDGGPFSQQPIFISGSVFAPLILNRARVVDYLGSGVTTNVPAGGLTFSNNDAFIDAGAIFTGTGSLTVGAGRSLGLRENVGLNVSLVNHGTVAPGLSLGVAGVNSNYFQFSDGLLAIDLAGTTVDTQYDRLISSSTAFLAGRLKVSLLNGFLPVVGNSFTVLTAQSIVGGFTSYDLPLLSTGKLWNIAQSSTGVTLTIVSDAADFNKDGVVDTRDYIYWRKTNGTPANYQLWRSNLGNRSGGVFLAGGASVGGGLLSGSVPEPSSGFLLLMAGMLTGCLRRPRQGAGRSAPHC